MSKNMVVAAVASFGLLSSTLALAEVTVSPAIPANIISEAPVLVAANVATPILVEPGSESALTPPPSLADADDDGQPATSLAELVQESDGGALTDSDADAKCLATAVYYEARSESLSGQLAVANVVLQRARSGRFPSSLCGVVMQPGQFSFVRGGQMPEAPVNAPQWRTAGAIAQIAMAGSWDNPVKGALFFHATRVQPDWDRSRLARIGGHIFYR